MTRTADLAGADPLSMPMPAKTAGVGVSLARKAQPTSNVYELSGHAATAAGSVVVEDETPRRKFVKDIARVGTYLSNAGPVKITAADMDRWVESSKKYLAAGNKIAIPDGHTTEATANRGYVLDLYREGDTLYMLAEMIGEDGISAAARSDVSINTDVDYVDGSGNHYPDVITHVALTNQPVIPSMDGFVPIAASRGKPTRARLYRLALSTETNMEALTKIAAMLGVKADGMDETTLADAIAKSIEAMQGLSKEADKKADDLTAELSTVKASLSKTKEEPSPVLVRIAAENRELKLSKLVSDGRITPAVKDKLAAIWIGKDNAGLKLSLDSTGDGQFAAMVEALSENDPVKLGEQTAAQGVALSRNTNTKPDLTKPNASIVDDLAKHAGVRSK